MFELVLTEHLNASGIIVHDDVTPQTQYFY